MKSLRSFAALLPLFSACVAPVDGPYEQSELGAPDKADIATCDGSAVAWAHTTEWPSYYGLSRFARSPNGELLFRWAGVGSEIYRAGDGSAVVDLGRTTSLSRDFSLRVDRTAKGDQEVVRGEDSLVARIAEPRENGLPGWIAQSSAAVASDATRIYVLECARRFEPEQSRVRVQRLSAADPSDMQEIAIPSARCDDNWLMPTEVRPLPDRDAVAIVGLEGGVVAIVDFDSGSVTRRSFGALPPEAEHYYDRQLIVGSDVSPDGSTLAIASEPGTIDLLDARTLESIETFPALVHRSNPFSYGPARVSPVAFDETGSRLAFANEVGKVAIRNLDTGEIERTLALPPLSREVGTGEGQDATAQGFLFLGDDLVVGSDAGTFRFGCGAGAPALEETLTLDVRAPSWVWANQEFEIETRVTGSTGPTLKWFSVDDQSQYNAGLGAKETFMLIEPGTHHLRFTAHDGVHTGTAELDIVVMAR